MLPGIGGKTRGSRAPSSASTQVRQLCDSLDLGSRMVCPGQTSWVTAEEGGDFQAFCSSGVPSTRQSSCLLWRSLLPFSM